ncbi:MAG: adenosylcobinamide-GDP ribazoletransferase [Syntrophomonadaceae bacterium]
MDAFLTSLAFLTRIPVPQRSNSFDSTTFSRSIIFFPLAGLIIGLVNGGLYLLLGKVLPIHVLAVITIMVPIFMSGGMHFDGLLDTCDGIFSGRSREKSLEIMRDSRVGSMGVIAGILDVLLRYTLLLSLPGEILPLLLITQPVAGRWVISVALHLFPYARKEGGLGQGFNQHKNVANIILSTGLTLLIIYALSGFNGLVVVGLAGVASLLIALWASYRLGGLTGDVYGALNEAAEIMFILLWLAASQNLDLGLYGPLSCWGRF